MHSCFVCQFQTELSNDLHNHMNRHRKVDLIGAMIKQPLTSDGTSTSTSSTLLTCPSISEISAVEEKLDIDEEEINNNCSSTETNNGRRRATKGNPRRSCRLKDIMNRFDPDKDHMPFDSIDDNYYIPNESIMNKQSNLPFSDDSEEDAVGKTSLKRAKCRRKSQKGRKKKIRVEPVLLTPKIEKEPTSDTDSCSGNALVSATSERIFCNYCGSGYRTESMLADHIRYNHLNFCTLCEVNFPDVRRYKEHSQKHLVRIYVCSYCDTEFSARDILSLHVQRHLQTSVLDNVLSLEEEYFTDRNRMNTLYNMFNAGFQYGRRSSGNFGVVAKLPAEFYKVFLQYSSYDVEKIDNFGYLCRTCGFTLFDRSLYRDHLQIVHGIATSDFD